jgi:cob(I)alamin adenosyltransferase
MPKPIYTKKGNKGRTDLLSGERVKKIEERVEVFGTLDELNSSLGVAKVFSSDLLKENIQKVQKTLFFINSELASTKKEDYIHSIGSDDVSDLEKIIDKFQNKLPELKSFVIPGGTKSSAFLDLSRAICRRAERRLFSFNEKNDINLNLLKYINRLSDFLFVLARYANQVEGKGDLFISREGTFRNTPKKEE